MADKGVRRVELRFAPNNGRRHGVLINVRCFAPETRPQQCGGSLRWGAAIYDDAVTPRCGIVHRLWKRKSKLG
jgi:hypothetical protein